MSTENCICGALRLRNGNCPKLQGKDGLPLQCIGRWGTEKHDYLRRYIEATAGPRGKFIPPKGRGGAAFIDLFAGPGRALVRKTQKEVDGSPLLAWRHARSPFTKIILCDLDHDNVAALKKRTRGESRVDVLRGDTNQMIEEIVGLIPEHGLNIALLDPFAPKAFSWSTIEALGWIKRMDLLIHFPTGPLKRNFHNRPDFTAMVGTDAWQRDVKRASDVPKLVGHLRRSLALLGYENEGVKDLPVKNNTEGVLYHLVYATKDKLGNKIWKSISKIDARGQRGFGF